MQDQLSDAAQIAARSMAEAMPAGIVGVEGRQPSVRHFAPLFAYGHLPVDSLRRELASVSADFAAAMMRVCGDGPELAAGLRKLLEAKDCFVRAAL